MLQLHKTEGGAEYAEFLHAPKKKFSDFGMQDFLVKIISSLQLRTFTVR